MYYRKKPVIVQAFRLASCVFEDLPGWMTRRKTVKFLENDQGYIDELFIPTLEGTMRARAGDWIIRGVKGEIYPCRPDVFEATYEKVEHGTD